MHQTKLLSIINLLVNSKELTEATKFIASPYYNTNPILITLFNEIKKYASNLKSRNLRQKVLFKKVFPHEPFDEKKWGKIKNKLVNLLERYMTVKEVEKDKFLQKKLLAKGYENRNNYSRYASLVKTLQKLLEERHIKDLEYLIDKIQLLQHYFFHPETYKYKIETDEVIQLMETVDLLFILAKLRYSSELKSRQQGLAIKYEIKLLDEALQLATTTYKEFNLTIDLYTNFIQFLDPSISHNPASLQKCIQLFKRHFDQVGIFEQHFWIQLLLNYSSTGLGRGLKDFSKHSVELYQLAIDKEVLFENDILELEVYINMGVVGAVSGQFTWCRKIIDEYKEFLFSKDKDIGIYLVEAYWYYHKAQNDNREDYYEKALNFLGKVPRTHLGFITRAYSLRLRVFFDYALISPRKDLMDVLRKADAFKKYLTQGNDILSKSRIDSYFNFIQKLKALVKFWDKVEQQTKEDLILFEREVETSIVLFAKYWFQDKITELRKKFSHLRISHP